MNICWAYNHLLYLAFFHLTGGPYGAPQPTGNSYGSGGGGGGYGGGGYGNNTYGSGGGGYGQAPTYKATNTPIARNEAAPKVCTVQKVSLLIWDSVVLSWSEIHVL